MLNDANVMFSPAGYTRPSKSNQDMIRIKEKTLVIIVL